MESPRSKEGPLLKSCYWGRGDAHEHAGCVWAMLVEDKMFLDAEDAAAVEAWCVAGFRLLCGGDPGGLPM